MNKLVVTLIVAFIFCSHCFILEAKRVHYTENAQVSSTSNEVAWPPELDHLKLCLAKCNPDDQKCNLDCVEKNLKQIDPSLLQELFQGALNIVQRIFCTLGCVTSQVCSEVDDIGNFLYSKKNGVTYSS